jgi:hypothetical protein
MELFLLDEKFTKVFRWVVNDRSADCVVVWLCGCVTCVKGMCDEHGNENGVEVLGNGDVKGKVRI